MNSSTSSFRSLLFAYLVACLGVLMLLVGASEWLVRTKVFPQDTMRKHIALFDRTTSPYVAFGDSHVARGFDAAAPVVNLAYPSENIEKMAWKAARYLEKTPSVEAVLIQADPHLFASYRTEAGLGDYPAIFVNDNRKTLLSLSARYRPQLPALWQSFVTSGGRLRSTIETTVQGALLSPGNLAAWPPAQVIEFTELRLKLHAPEASLTQSRQAVLYREMVMSFTDAGAMVCLVSFPTSPVYRKHFADMNIEIKQRWDEARDFFVRLAQHPNIQFVDHTARYGDPELFRDPDHLNKGGAVLYGPVLQETCFNNARGAVIAEMESSER